MHLLKIHENMEIYGFPRSENLGETKHFITIIYWKNSPFAQTPVFLRQRILAFSKNKLLLSRPHGIILDIVSQQGNSIPIGILITSILKEERPGQYGRERIKISNHPKCIP